MKKSLCFLVPLLGLFLLQALFIAFYLGQEKMIPFWDYAMYHNMAKNLASATSFSGGWVVFEQSFAQNYNLLFALPSLLTFSLFENTRLVFIETNFFFFILPTQIAFGLILARIFSWPKLPSLLGAAIGLSLLPFFWVPLLVGYPDHAGLACLGFALFFALSEKRGWKEAVAIGLLLSLSIIFRRPFAYGALALLLALGVLDLVSLIKKRSSFKDLLLFYLPCGLAALGLLVGVEYEYFQIMLSENYMALYKAYDQGALAFSLFSLSRLGVGLFVLVLGGWFFIWQEKKAFSPMASLLLLFSGLWFFIWAFGPAQLDEHYLLPAFPLFCLIGFAGLYKGVRSYIYISVIAFALAANASYALYFAERTPISLEEKTKIALESSPRPPWVRKDYDALYDLTSYIGSRFKKHDIGVLVSSSYLLNLDIIREISVNHMNRPSIVQRFLPTPEIDHVQPPPSENYAAGTLFVVAEPAQYHVNPEGQKVFTALKNQIPPQGGVGTFFEKYPKTFTLDDGVKVSIWRKNTLPPALLHLSLEKIAKDAGAGEKWVSLQRAEGRMYAPASSHSAHVRLQFSDTRNTAEILFDEPLLPGLYRLGMRFHHQAICMQPQMILRFRTPGGEIVHEDRKALPKNTDLSFTDFSIPLGQKGVFFLSLQLKMKAYGSCSATLYDLEIDKVNVRNQYEPLIIHKAPSS